MSRYIPTNTHRSMCLLVVVLSMLPHSNTPSHQTGRELCNPQLLKITTTKHCNFTWNFWTNITNPNNKFIHRQCLRRITGRGNWPPQTRDYHRAQLKSKCHHITLSTYENSKKPHTSHQVYTSRLGLKYTPKTSPMWRKASTNSSPWHKTIIQALCTHYNSVLEHTQNILD